MSSGAWRRLAVGAAVTAGAVGLSSCASSAALGLARSACSHVERSIRLYDASLRASPTRAAADRAAATAQLEAAQPDAATAAGEDAQWQALMTTISESPRVPERYLVYALGQQCRVAYSPGGQGLVPTGPPPPIPGTPGSAASSGTPGSASSSTGPGSAAPHPPATAASPLATTAGRAPVGPRR